ncbi:MAG: AAA family ATPase [Patescibacteria group bacterium]
MLFKRLEISGFKSFAKAVTLEFPSAISAIVGPNGSGKSNVADSIRWVLGEQSLKNLRGKKGEDLIFAGTESVPKMGKASVNLVFDNKKNQFGLEFDEVIIGRRVYRDGVNEYTLNDSVVRLKDIIELLSKVDLGASQHHIIAQGDADRILFTSPAERKLMVSDALGLRIYEFKKAEAERKIERTEENIKDIESLKRELAPHLKYLKTQAEKAKGAEDLKKSLFELSLEYVQRELKTLEEAEKELSSKRAPALEKVKALSLEIQKSESAFGKSADSGEFFAELKKLDSAREEIAVKRRQLDKELIKLEVAGEKKPGPDNMMPRSRVKEILLELVSDLEKAGREGSFEGIRNAIFSSTQKIYGILENMQGFEKSPNTDVSKGPSEIKEELKKLETEEKNILDLRKILEVEYQKKNSEAQKAGAIYKQTFLDLQKAKEILQNLSFEEERLKTRLKDLETDFPSFKDETSQGEIFALGEREEQRRKIERFRIRLEEAGGVDSGVLKEYEEAEKRSAFLEKELKDLLETKSSLDDLFSELDEKIEKDFKFGIAKINSLFGKFFNEIFGGGSAEIKLIEPKEAKNMINEETGEMEEVGETEGGIDIMVNIPRKRIKSLNMLSGGERALTSIALLFAVSTVNPPPFLVLDETDAALDEANSRKYGNMLKELSKKAQLIVITHNRETMRATDVLYGVTIGRDGVSSLLSIKFEEAENLVKK